MNQNTLEQYAFAIGFDFELDSNTLSEPSDAVATATLEAVGNAIQSAGLPALESDRWDEFGQGHIFWGTKSECDAVKQVLLQFPVFLQEERNLDPGYYANASNTYHVDDVGNVYRLLNPESGQDNALAAINSIPLDAYRVQSIDPNLHAAVERSLNNFSPEPSPPVEAIASSIESASVEAQRELEQEIHVLRELRAQQTIQINELESFKTAATEAQTTAEQEINQLRAQLTEQTAAQTNELELFKTAAVAAQAAAEQEVNDLKTQLEQQTHHVRDLERQVTVFEDRISALQHAAATKIDPQQLDDLQAQFAQQTLQLQQVEARLVQAEGHVKAWEIKAEQWIDPQSYTQIQQQLNAKIAQSQELEQRIARNDQQLQDAVAIASRKVDAAKYQALEQTLAEKAAQTEELRRVIVQLQRDIGEWQTVADAKVEWSEYQDLQQELQRLQAKQKKGFFARLFSLFS
jgi:hypothetical protein